MAVDGAVASAVDPPAAAVGDAGELLDVDMDQLAGPVALVAAHRFAVGGPVAPIEAAEPGGAQDRLHGRGGQPDLMGDVVGAPTALAAQLDHLDGDTLGCPVR